MPYQISPTIGKDISSFNKREKGPWGHAQVIIWGYNLFEYKILMAVL